MKRNSVHLLNTLGLKAEDIEAHCTVYSEEEVHSLSKTEI